jgi:hypothetical protein
MKAMKFMSLTVLTAMTAGILGGCYVEQRRPYYYHHPRPVVVVPVR